MKDLEISVAEAQRYLDAGNAAVADIICRRVLERSRNDADAWRLLARIAEIFGEADTGREYRRRADEASGASAGSGAVSSSSTSGRGSAGTKASSTDSVGSSAPERFILIKAWGNGFFSDVDHTLGGLLLADMSGRTPVIHWGRNSLFGRSPDEDAFREFFEPPSPLTVHDLMGRGYDFFPPKWHEGNLLDENVHKQRGPWSRLSGLHLLNRPEQVVVLDYHTGIPVLLPWVRPGHPLHGLSVEAATRRLVRTYLRPRPHILEQIERFARERFDVRPVIAAHVRGSDKEKEDPFLARKIAMYPELIRRFAGSAWAWRVFLLTDSDPVRRQFDAAFPGRVITTDCIRTETQVGLHYQGFPDRARLGVEVVVDAWLAARCDFFIGMGSSNVSCMIYHLRDWTPATRVLIGPPMTHLANPFLYMTHEQLSRYLPPEVMERLARLA